MANGFLTTTELDFTNYRDSLKTYLSQQDVFKDYDFDGSNMAVLLDLLAYNTYMNGQYLNLIGSEMFLDTASLRESIVSHAKELNYTPRSRTAPVAYVNITIDTGTDTPDTLTIPKYFQINGYSPNNAVYTFTTDEVVIIRANNGIYRAANVAIYEGNIVKEVFIANNDSRYLLQSANVDISSINVTIKASQAATLEEKWNKKTFLFGLQATDKVFFIQGAESHLYELVFGNGNIGRALDDGNVINVVYRETNGDEANGLERFVAPGAVEGYDTVTVATVVAAAGGAEHESDEEIKFNAPRYFPTQERAITVEDFVALTKNQFPSLQVVTAFGGEEIEPKQYGKVIIAAKPFGNETMPTPLKTQIYNFLKERTSISIDPVVVDPDYFYAEVISRVLYNINLTTSSSRDIGSTVENAIGLYGSTYLEKFGADLRFSKLVKAIDDSEAAIISNITEVRIVKHVVIDKAVPTRVTFAFDNEIFTDGSTVRKIYEEVKPSFESSLFTYFVGDIEYQARIKDDGIGNLVLVSVVNNNVILLKDKIGTIDYTTGNVTISEIEYYDFDGNYVEFYGRTARQDIETATNKILLITPEHIEVIVTGIRE